MTRTAITATIILAAAAAIGSAQSSDDVFHSNTPSQQPGMAQRAANNALQTWQKCEQSPAAKRNPHSCGHLKANYLRLQQKANGVAGGTGAIPNPFPAAPKQNPRFSNQVNPHRAADEAEPPGHRNPMMPNPFPSTGKITRGVIDSAQQGLPGFQTDANQINTRTPRDFRKTGGNAGAQGGLSGQQAWNGHGGFRVPRKATNNPNTNGGNQRNAGGNRGTSRATGNHGGRYKVINGRLIPVSR